MLSMGEDNRSETMYAEVTLDDLMRCALSTRRLIDCNKDEHHGMNALIAIWRTLLRRVACGNYTLDM